MIPVDPDALVALDEPEAFPAVVKLVLDDSIVAPGGGAIRLTLAIEEFTPKGTGVELREPPVTLFGAPGAIIAPGGGGILTPGGRPPMEAPLSDGSITVVGTPEPPIMDEFDPDAAGADETLLEVEIEEDVDVEKGG